MRIRKPQLTHEERMAEIRADERMLKLLADANVGEAELIELLAQASAKKARRAARREETEEEIIEDREDFAERIYKWGADTEVPPDKRPLLIRAQEIVDEIRLHPGNGGKGFVYFIETRGGEFLKIGYSLFPKKRLLELSTGSCKSLNVIGWMPGTLGLEHAIHAKFSNGRGNGEWFEGSALLKQFINLLDLVRQDPGFRYRVPEFSDDDTALIDWEQMRREDMGRRLRNWE